MKTCSICKIEKELPEFGKNSSTKDGLRCECRKCRSLLGKLSYNKNKEIINKKSKIYRDNNKSKISIQRKGYRNKNKESIKLSNKKWYIDNKESVLLYRRDWAKKNNEKVVTIRKRYKQTDKAKLFAINDANKRRMSEVESDDGTITTKFLLQLAKETTHCIFTGIELTPENRHLDHIIPLSRGGKHTASNVRFISAKANMMKHNKTDEEFEIWLCKKYIAEASVIHNEIMKAS